MIEDLETGGPVKSWRIPAIDGLRALAILMVYTYHVWQFGGSPARYIEVAGHRLNYLRLFHDFPAGVDLFMVLSGFCLFLPLCRNVGGLGRLEIGAYFRKRLRRIVPPYYAAIFYVTLLPQLLVALFRLLHQPAKWQPVPSVWQFVTHLLFIHTLSARTWDGINGSFWSLGLEMQFYITFPLLVFMFRRFGYKAIATVVGLSLAYRVCAGAITAHSPWVTQFLASIFFLGR